MTCETSGLFAFPFSQILVPGYISRVIVVFPWYMVNLSRTVVIIGTTACTFETLRFAHKERIHEFRVSH
jgi:hypothetical protein